MALRNRELHARNDDGGLEELEWTPRCQLHSVIRVDREGWMVQLPTPQLKCCFSCTCT